MKYKSLTGLAALLPLAACSDKAQQPNIVFFLVDDFGWVDSSVQYGEELYPNNLRFNTPNMQRLSERSTVFGNAYACAVSTPTRTSIMTGMNAAHTGITNWTSALRDIPSDGVNGDTYANAVIVANGVWVYQLDKKGLAVELSLKGARITPFRTLN